jgi:hypothetical protein
MAWDSVIIGKGGVGVHPVAGQDRYPDITVTVTAPIGLQSIVSPLVTWTFVSALGNTQDTYRILIYDDDGTTVIADSDWQSGADVSWQTPFQLSAGNNLTVQVTAISDVQTTGFDIDTFHIIVPSVDTDTMGIELVNVVATVEAEHGTLTLEWVHQVSKVEVSEDTDMEPRHTVKG